MLCFAGQNVSWKMGGEAFPAGGCGTRSVIGTDHGRIGAAVELKVQASFSQLQTSSTFTFRGKSRTKASFHIPLLISGDGSSR